MAKQTPAFGPAGQRLLDAVTGEYALDAHERELLEQAAHCVDTMHELQRVVDRDGQLIQKDYEGPLRPHPALAELRAQKNSYIRLFVSWGCLAGLRQRSGRVRVQQSLRWASCVVWAGLPDAPAGR